MKRLALNHLMMLLALGAAGGAWGQITQQVPQEDTESIAYLREPLAPAVHIIRWLVTPDT